MDNCATGNIISKLKDDHKQLIDHLSQARLPSLGTTVDDVFKKALLLYAASYYETLMTRILINLYEDNCCGNPILAEFVKNQALAHQYSKLFQWRDNNANSFFGLFGGNFKNYMKEKVKNSSNLSESVKAFLELGELRNQATHRDLATFSLDKTADEVFELYQQAELFIDMFSAEINDYIQSTQMCSELSTMMKTDQ